MPFFVVRYTYTDDTTGRDGLRPSHKEYLADAAERGLILVSGPFTAAAEAGAAMIYHAPDEEAVRAVVEGDPFRTAGHVADYTVTEWIPMIGRWANDARRLTGAAS